ncbi:MAG TPA: (Fe-S)-binding protein [Saprospiraceae bacterium]|nr:(Fe-S)-binding protein [Saprospiraceae bacterium]
MAECTREGKVPDVLFWVGCAGSFDARAQKISRAFATLLQHAGVSFAILGNEEMCSGDPARRAGNEFLFQMLALQNIQTLNGYGITKIVTACPHCFNTLKNEYPDLGGRYQVMHHTQLLRQLIAEGRIKINTNQNERVTYHDSCYLGRTNGIYEVPREIIQELGVQLKEMTRSKQIGLCCGAGGAQMFKEDEPGKKRINTERVEEVIKTGAGSVVANCPFCMTMLTDGLKEREKQDEIKVYDISELVLNNMIK